MRRLPWLTALPVGVVLTVAMMMILPRYLGYGTMVDLPGVVCVFLCVAGISYLVMLGVQGGADPAHSGRRR